MTYNAKKLVLSFFKTRTGVLCAGMWILLFFFIADWCMSTTFRGMSEWLLYPVNILAGLILTLPYIITRRTWVQAIIMSATALLLLCNIMYCRTYFTAIPLDSYALAGNLSDFTASIVDSLSAIDIFFPIIVIATIIVACQQPKTNADATRPLMAYACGIVVSSLLTVFGIKQRGGFYNDYSTLLQSCYYSTTGVPIYTIGGHLLYQATHNESKLTQQTIAEVEQWKSDHNALVPFTPLPDSIQPRKSLVVILCESLESWPIEQTLDGQVITPYINSLIASPTTFYAPNMLTQVAAGRSIDCQLLLNCGLLPMTSSVYSMKYPQTNYPSLNKAMRQTYGAESYMFTCDKPITWNQAVINRAFGCNTLFDRSSWVIDELIGSPAKLSDGSFLRQSVAKLRNDSIWPIGESRYLTFVTYSGHNPFRLPEKFHDPAFTPDPEKYPAKMVDYTTMAHYTDNSLRTLVEYIKSRPDYNNTLVVITGDHEGLASDRSEILKNPAARAIVSPKQFTPFIVLNSPITGRYEAVMGQIDMYPTLLRFLGLGSYYWHGMGHAVPASREAQWAISSMTNEIVGDTTATPAPLLNHTLSARRISNAMITHNLFPG